MLAPVFQFRVFQFRNTFLVACLSLLQARLCPHCPDSFVEALTSNVLEDVFGDAASEKVVGVH